MTAEDSSGAESPNHPLAPRMAVIAGMSHNIVMGSIFGTAGVLLPHMQQRMNMPIGFASIGEPLVLIGSAIVSSVVGVLVARISLRLLLMTSVAMATIAWLILASSHSFLLYIIAYGLFLGPAMAMGGSVLPATLVTRWFGRNRGLALGLVHLPVVVTLLPVAIHWMVEHHGVEGAFLTLAALCGLVLLPATLFVVDRPPGRQLGHAAAPADDGLSIGQILARPRFWALALAVGAINTSSVVLNIFLVSMAISRGIDPLKAATLMTTMSMAGMAGSVLFGWVTDRIGGGRTMALIALDAGLLWLLLLTGLPFAGLMAVTMLIGMHGSGAIPALSRGLAEVFGRDNFSRAFGLSSTITLPLTLLVSFGTGRFVQLSGGYAPTILIMAAYFAVAIPLALYAAAAVTRGGSSPSAAQG